MATPESNVDPSSVDSLKAGDARSDQTPKVQPGAGPRPAARPGASKPASGVAKPQPVSGKPQAVATTDAAGKPQAAAQARADEKPAKPARPIPVRRRGGPEVDEREGPPEELSERMIKAAPPMLVSGLVHMILLIVLALIMVAQRADVVLLLSAEYAEDLGEQLQDDKMMLLSNDPVDISEPLISKDVNPVADPFAAPPKVTPVLDGIFATDIKPALSVGLALTGREKGMKQALLAKYGGTESTENAVKLALEWLKRNQQRDGSWSLAGPYTDGGFNENKTAATAMALLAFQGAGNTHLEGAYKEEVAKGWKALLKMQDADGNFFRNGIANHQLYSQAQATIAICEIYGMTKDSEFREPAQRAVDYAVRNQAAEGGWRYTPGSDSDTSVTGWFVMALQSALMAGLEVPSPTLDAITRYLDSVSLENGALYKYQPNRPGYSPAMSAEGLLCRQYLGWRRDDPRLVEGVLFLLENPIDWNGDKNSYYWYYATQVMHHMEGEAWDQWNNVMRQTLPRHQVAQGAERGSWDPANDRWGNHGGRLYMTCLCVYMLEVYYRHLPIYQYRLQ